MDVDPRLRAAVDASHAWYDALYALHGVGCSVRDGLWWAHTPPPPLHSGAKTLEPGVAVDRVVEALAGFGPTGVADSFGELDLTGHGFELLFEARWIHRAAEPADGRGLPPEWGRVGSAAELAEWNDRFDTAGVLLPGLLERSSFTVLRRLIAGRLVAGAVAQLCTGVVHLSNAWAEASEGPDWPALVEVVAALHPGRAIVGYESGDDLTGALAAGFVDVGPQLVWVR